jgi:indole-3-glycerol phosphate synthase
VRVTTSVLDAIVAGARRSALDRAEVLRAAVDRQAASATPSAAAFVAGLAGPGVRVIAECKRRSPSRGVLRRDYDPAAIAVGYEAAGAAAISVLTEPSFFDGSLDHLRAVRAAVRIPILRKDFIVTEFQIAEARAAGR